MIFGELAGNFRERGGDLIRLGGQNQNLRGLGDFKIGRKSFRAGFGGEMFPRGVKRVGGEKLVRLTSLALRKPLASAVAILPAPRKPILSGAAMRIL